MPRMRRPSWNRSKHWEATEHVCAPVRMHVHVSTCVYVFVRTCVRLSHLTARVEEGEEVETSKGEKQ